MEKVPEKTLSVKEKIDHLNQWRIESEFEAIRSLKKGDLLNIAYKRIMVQYHEMLHQIKVQTLTPLR